MKLQHMSTKFLKSSTKSILHH